MCRWAVLIKNFDLWKTISVKSTCNLYGTVSTVLGNLYINISEILSQRVMKFIYKSRSWQIVSKTSENSTCLITYTFTALRITANGFIEVEVLIRPDTSQ